MMTSPQPPRDSVLAFQQGKLPLLISFPHSGTWVPDSIKTRMTDWGRRLPDTDWELPRLYSFIARYQPSTLSASFSRYVIDPNRSTDGINLYPGKPTPQLCPLETFDGQAIYHPGEEPGQVEIENRTRLYWEPYHQQIKSELHRLRDEFGFAVLFDAHSIKSQVPRLFEGKLPDINIGTANGKSCDTTLQAAIEARLTSQSIEVRASNLSGRPAEARRNARKFWHKSNVAPARVNTCTYVINGRFIGGHITRHYGRPEQNLHAVQLELAQCRYMNEQCTTWDEESANQTRPILEGIIETIVNWIAERLPRSPL